MKGTILLVLYQCFLMASAENDTLKEFKTGNRRFSAAIYREMARDNGTTNFVISTLSLAVGLSLVNEGAGGNTSAELMTGALLHPKEKTQNAFKEFLPKLKHTVESLEIVTANIVYLGKNLEVQEKFKTAATSIYDAEAENVDFSKQEQAIETINEWVEDTTYENIKYIINAEDLTYQNNHTKHDTKIILINAMYFSGIWKAKFKGTMKRKFYKSKTESVKIDTLKHHHYFNYFENTNANVKVLELSYKGGDAKMMIILPNEIEGLPNVEANLEAVLTTPPQFKRHLISLELPRFSVQTTAKVIPILKKLGIQTLFTTKSDLAGMTSSDPDIHIDHIIQKASIDVTEMGTELSKTTSPKKPPSPTPACVPIPFFANHPFIYLIKFNDVIISIGRYIGPEDNFFKL